MRSSITPAKISSSPNVVNNPLSIGLLLYLLLLNRTPPGYLGVNALPTRAVKDSMHSLTPLFLMPRASAIMPPVRSLIRIHQYVFVCYNWAYLVPTIKSKKSWMGMLFPSSAWTLRSTSRITIPLIPPLRRLVRISQREPDSTYPSSERMRTPASGGLK